MRKIRMCPFGRAEFSVVELGGVHTYQGVSVKTVFRIG
jgi:hypothetical protein